MALFFQVFVEAFNRHILKGHTAREDILTGDFYKSCAKLCSCDTTEEFIEITTSLIKKLVSPSKPITVFCRTKSNHHKDVKTNITYSSNLIKISTPDKRWESIIIQEKEEFTTSGYFQPGERVLLLPVFSDKRIKYDLVFVAGHIEIIQHVELLDVLFEHVTACYSRLYKHSKITGNDDGFLTALFRLCADWDEHNASEMEVKVMKYLSEDLDCEKCCLLTVEDDLSNFVSRVIGSEILEVEYYTPLKGGFFGTMSRNRQPRIMQQFLPNEQDSLQELFKTAVSSFMCVPIISHSSKEVVALICACNKSNGQRFTVNDVSNVQTCLRYTWTLLTSSLALQKEIKVKDECQAMLQIARNLFSHLDDVTILLGEIIQEARTLTNAERCSVFLVNKETNELVAKVFDGIITVDESLDPRQYDFEGMNEVRLPLSQGIAGHVATTGQTLNITDAYSHPLFYRGIDEATGFKTRNILCFPIKDDGGNVVGVSQLCNKIKGHAFTQYDVDLAERFAVFSGISISHSLLYKQVIEVQCRNQLANELMTYHMKIRQEEVDQCLKSLPDSATFFDPDFSNFVYSPRMLDDELKCMASVQMYIELDLVARFHISTKTLTKFIMMVKEGYRNPPYHNWNHAFSVAHHAYLMAKNLNFGEIFGDLEVLALLTASLCHDLDHRGTNNAFQVSSASTLAALYSSQGSVLEHHHFAQAMCILNSGSCNIFENMSKVDYVRVLDLIKDIILATDVAHHLKIVPKLEEMAERRLDPSNCNEEEKSLLLDLSMTACDLSDQTKDWKNTKNTAELIYKEFFSQGDMEKSRGILPAITNDRERACVPELQINFMEHIARPAYRILSVIFPPYTEAYDRFDSNVERWRLVCTKFKELGLPNTGLLDFITEDFEKELF
ncbi:cGMP-dependent 3',5'-cyclic phosphodiesterase-like isoform X2 [Styela clava]